MSKVALTAAASLFLITTACQTVPYAGKAREVKKKPQDGGTIAIPVEYRQEDRDRAEEKMAMNCKPYTYKIMSEEEIVVGETTETNSRDTYRANSQQSSKFLGMNLVTGDAGGTDNRSSSTKTALKEWQIGYACDSSRATASKKR